MFIARRQYASRIDGTVRGDVVDIAPRDTDVLQGAVAQGAQGGARLLTLASFAEGIQESLQDAENAPR